jgi:hypothetical protein
VRARSHGALKEKMQKGKTEYEKHRKKLEKA